MAVINLYKITVNIKNKTLGQLPQITANDSVVFDVEVYDDTSLFSLSPDYIYMLVTKKRSGKSVIREGSLVDGLIRFELGSSEMTEPGKVEATVQILDETNKRVSTARFDYIIAADPSTQGGLPTDDKTLVIANESLMLNSIQKSEDATQIAETASLKAEEQKQRVDELIANTPQPSEVVDARGGEAVLGERLNKFDALMAQTETKLKVLNSNEIEWIAHRGFDALVPENTMTAFSYALANGANSPECDVQISADGIPVVIHDTTVNRTTNGTGNVADLTLAQLKALDAGSKFSSRFAGSKIPTFDEFLKYAKGRATNVYPEIKGYRTVADVELMVNVVKANQMEHMCVFQSFDINILAQVRKYDKDVVFGFLRGVQLPTESDFQKLEDDGNSRFIVGYSLLIDNPNIVNDLTARGIGITVYNVTTKDEVKKCLELGATKIMSDRYIGGVR